TPRKSPAGMPVPPILPWSEQTACMARGFRRPDPGPGSTSAQGRGVRRTPRPCHLTARPSGSARPGPVGDVPEPRVPGVHPYPLTFLAPGGYTLPGPQRDDAHVLDDQVVELDDQIPPSRRIRLLLELLPEPVVLGVVPALVVVAAPLVRLLRDLLA